MRQDKPRSVDRRVQRRFVLQVLLLVPVTLAVWWSVAVDYLVDPFIHLFTWLPPAVFSGTVTELRPVQTTWGSWEALTTLSSAAAPESLLSLVIPVQRLSVGLPVFWALQVPTPTRFLWRTLALGTLIQLCLVPGLMLLHIQFHIANHAYPGSAGLNVGAAPTLDPSQLVHALSQLGEGFAERFLPFIVPLLTWLALNPRVFKLGERPAKRSRPGSGGRRKRQSRKSS